MKLNDSTFNFFFTSAITLVICIGLYFMEGSLSKWTIVSIFLISYPWKFGKNIYSFLGGQNSEGDVVSLFGIAQYGEKVFSIGPSIIQEAVEKEAFTFLGFAVYQKSEEDTAVFLGFSFYQKAEEDALVGIGFALLQFAKNKALVAFGIPLVQRAPMIGVNWSEVWKN
jgi:hypothetical protein